MSATRLGPRDVTATVVVGAAAAYFGAHEGGLDIVGSGSARAVAAVILILGAVGCGAGADADALQHGIKGPAVRALSLLGGAALVVGLLALALATGELVTALFALTIALWAGATFRHLFAEPSVAEYPTAPARDLINSGR